MSDFPSIGPEPADFSILEKSEAENRRLSVLTDRTLPKLWPETARLRRQARFWRFWRIFEGGPDRIEAGI